MQSYSEFKPRDVLLPLMAPGEPFHDFPIKDRFLFEMDGWQTSKGPHFNPKFYQGMDKGMAWVAKFLQEKRDLTAHDLEELHRQAYLENETYHGFRDNKECNFPASFRNSQKEEIGISEEGLAEFEEEWKAAKQGYAEKNKADAKKSCWELKDKEEGNVCTPADLKNKPDKRIRIYTSAVPKEWIASFLNAKLAEFYAFARKEKEPEKIRQAIIKLVRKLHQHHIFLDGNGRTLVFLLQNILLYQWTHRWSRVETPFHFAGFSTDQLLNEQKTGMDNFENCKITKAKQFILEQISFENKNQNEDFKSQLRNKISSDPTISLAQLNELFYQIDNKQIELKDGSPKSLSSLKEMIKELYLEEFEKSFSKCGSTYAEHVQKNHEIIQQIPGLAQLLHKSTSFKPQLHDSIETLQNYLTVLKTCKDEKQTHSSAYAFYLKMIEKLFTNLLENSALKKGEDDMDSSLEIFLNTEGYTNNFINSIMMEYYNRFFSNAKKESDFKYTHYGNPKYRKVLILLDNHLNKLLSAEEIQAKKNECQNAIKIGYKKFFSSHFDQENIASSFETQFSYAFTNPYTLNGTGKTKEEHKKNIKEFFHSFGLLNHLSKDPFFALHQLNFVYSKLDGLFNTQKKPVYANLFTQEYFRSALKEVIIDFYQENLEKLEKDKEWLKEDWLDIQRSYEQHQIFKDSLPHREIKELNHSARFFQPAIPFEQVREEYKQFITKFNTLDKVSADKMLFDLTQKFSLLFENKNISSEYSDPIV